MIKEYIVLGDTREMEENTLHQLIKSGRFMMGIYIFIPSMTVIDIVAWAGFDYIILDTEHVSYDL